MRCVLTIYCLQGRRPHGLLRGPRPCIDQDMLFIDQNQSDCDYYVNVL